MNRRHNWNLGEGDNLQASSQIQVIRRGEPSKRYEGGPISRVRRTLASEGEGMMRAIVQMDVNEVQGPSTVQGSPRIHAANLLVLKVCSDEILVQLQR